MKAAEERIRRKLEERAKHDIRLEMLHKAHEDELIKEEKFKEIEDRLLSKQM